VRIHPEHDPLLFLVHLLPPGRPDVSGQEGTAATSRAIPS
jgi:hypothetical protein